MSDFQLPHFLPPGYINGCGAVIHGVDELVYVSLAIYAVIVHRVAHGIELAALVPIAKG